MLVAVCKGMQAVKLCTNKILQFLTGGFAFDLYNGHKTVAVLCSCPMKVCEHSFTIAMPEHVTGDVVYKAQFEATDSTSVGSWLPAAFTELANICCCQGDDAGTEDEVSNAAASDDEEVVSDEDDMESEEENVDLAVQTDVSEVIVVEKKTDADGVFV